MALGIKPFFCFYGGKWRSGPRYPPPGHERIIEPFAGSAGYSLRYPDHRVVLVDSDPVITGVWSYLLRVSEEEIRRLPVVFGHVDEIPAPQEAKWLIGFWLNKGVSAPCLTPSKWMRSGIRPNSFWSKPIRERVASQLARVRHWEVVEGSYEEAPVGAEACWFIDPPYQYTGRYYRHSEIDYAHLAMWVRGLRGQVIVCENEGADWLPFRPFRACKATHGKHRTGRSAEVIYYRDQETKKGP